LQQFQTGRKLLKHHVGLPQNTKRSIIMVLEEGIFQQRKLKQEQSGRNDDH